MSQGKKELFHITFNGFHGYETHRVWVEVDPEVVREDYYGFEKEEPGYRITLSPSGSKKFGCHILDCRCGEGVGGVGDKKFSSWISESDYQSKSMEIKGSYPQGV